MAVINAEPKDSSKSIKKTNTGLTWIEVREEDHILGQINKTGWAYSEALWSPSTRKDGGKIYELMKKPRKGDMVLHFLKHSGERTLHGTSIVANKYEELSTPPKEASGYEWAKSFFKIELKNFSKLEKPLNINNFTENYDVPLRHEIINDQPPDYPFAIRRFKDQKFSKDSQVTLKQGQYLNSCSNKLHFITGML